MIKLLNSNFYRLKKSVCFWILLIVMIYLGAFIYNNYNPIDTQCFYCDNKLGDVLFTFTSFICILLPIFTSLFIGTEYSDGGIRYKIIKGHTRTNIYLSNLLTSIIVCFIYTFVFLISVNIMGFIFGNQISIPQNIFINLLVDSIMLNIFTSSLFTFIAQTISNKTSSIIISLCAVVWSLMIPTNLQQKISYSEGFIKKIYQLILNIIPSGQAYQIIEIANKRYLDTNIPKIDPTNQYQILWIYSLCLSIIISIYGIYLLNKKELN